VCCRYVAERGKCRGWYLVYLPSSTFKGFVVDCIGRLKEVKEIEGWHNQQKLRISELLNLII
jgi:hypothetical protein